MFLEESHKKLLSFLNVFSYFLIANLNSQSRLKLFLWMFYCNLMWTFYKVLQSKFTVVCPLISDNKIGFVAS